MTALRTTQQGFLQPAHSLARQWVYLALLGVFGCGTALPPSDNSDPATATSFPGTNDPNWLTSRDKLPAPDTDRIEYDASKRTLTLYDLPGRDRWMMQLPDEAKGRPIGPQHRIPDGVDTSRTLVYYARPGAKISISVTISQIESGRGPHTSLALVQ